MLIQISTSYKGLTFIVNIKNSKPLLLKNSAQKKKWSAAHEYVLDYLLEFTINPQIAKASNLNICSQK